MNSARLLLLLVGVAFLWFLVRQLLTQWLGGPDRKREHREIDAEDRAIEREAGDDIPRCPSCGEATRLHSYPHIKVWRCVKYPSCRGFVKAKKPSRPGFAAEWERRNRRGKG